jgi:signal transduction histidine kinase/CheY-like chemotaxis protein
MSDIFADHPDAKDVGRTLDKLKKINAALMKRVERSMDQQANAFSLFQTAINQETQIRLRTEELNHALSKLAHTNVELSQARDAAERANTFKTHFFTAVGHDLLQPLNAARLTLSELMDVQDKPEGIRLAQSISNALVTIEELLTSILDISKLEAGVFVPNIQTVALSGIFEQLVGNLEPVTRRKHLDFRWRPTTLAVRSDPLMLRRMLQNLLANASRYTESGALLLAARRRGDHVAIEVWDTGPGILPQEREHIFKEFQRGTASHGSAGTGFGLGLAIVRRMSEALGHGLTLDSRLGHGSRFAITAPYAAPVPASGPDVKAAPRERADLVAKPMIVIDNDLGVLEAMQTLLSRWGADVRLARDLDEISEILADPAFAPAIILADYHLDGGILGIEAVARIRQETGRDVPGILITADRTEAVAHAARHSNCELLHKPIRPAELRALMQHMLA